MDKIINKPQKSLKKADVTTNKVKEPTNSYSNMGTNLSTQLVHQPSNCDLLFKKHPQLLVVKSQRRATGFKLR